MSERIVEACKELIDNARMGYANLVFNESCLEILSKAYNISSDKQFRQLVAYATEKLIEDRTVTVQPELTIQR
jgi:hypothetical protein